MNKKTIEQFVVLFSMSSERKEKDETVYLNRHIAREPRSTREIGNYNF